jgi:hypothetical protein
VAHVQILLDTEELPWEDAGAGGGSSGGEDRREDAACQRLRGRAVAAAFGHHAYEFDACRLPGRDQSAAGAEEYLAKDAVP